MIVIKEAVEKELNDLEKILKVCSDNVMVKKASLKYMLLHEVSYLKWKLDKIAVDDWCKKKNLELYYFETEKEFNKWQKLEEIKIEQNFNFEYLMNKQKNDIEKIKDLIQSQEMKKLEIQKEILLLEMDCFHQVSEKVINID